MSQEDHCAQADNRFLLKEYELCQVSTEHLESRIWQTSATIGIGSIGTLFLVANHPLEEQPSFLVAALLGTVVLLTSLIWWRMARRWWSIQHAKYLRMRHIEEELGLYQTRYVDFLDHPERLPQSGLSKDRQEDLRRLPNYQKLGVQACLKLLPAMVGVSWGLYLFVRLLLIPCQILLALE